MEEENEKTENNVVVTTLNTDGKVMQLFLPTEVQISFLLSSFHAVKFLVIICMPVTLFWLLNKMIVV